MSTPLAHAEMPSTRTQIVDTLHEEAGVWLFVFKTLLAFYVTGWLAMRLSLPQPSTAMLTTIVVASRQSGLVLAKSFYRTIGTLVGALVAILIIAAFPQQRVLFLSVMSLWIGLCAGGATLYRNFMSYAFVLAGYTAAIIAIPVVAHPPQVFDSAVARISEVLLGLLVSGIVSDIVFPIRMRDVLRRTGREQFAHFIDFIQRATGGDIAREAMEKAHLRFVRDAVTFEDLRSSVIFEDPEARARSGNLLLFNQRFMAASTSFQSLHHLINRLQHGANPAPARALIELYAPIGVALDAPIEAGAAARVVLPRLMAARQAMDANAIDLRGRLASASDQRDFDTGASLLHRFADELHAYVESAANLQAPRPLLQSAERVRFARGNDFVGAALAVLRTTLIMLALSVFWIESAWPMGASAMLLATIFAGLLATASNPSRILRSTLIGYALGMLLCFVCTFFVLNQMDGYTLFAVASAPFLMIGLWLMVRPSSASFGLGYSMGFAYILAVKNLMVFDPAHFLNDAISQLVGLGAAAIAFIIVPPAIGSLWLRRRQLDHLRHQVALAAQAPLPGLRHRFESVNHDLFSQVVAQTEAGSDDSRALIAWALAVHETGRALIELRAEMVDRRLPEAVSASIQEAIAAIAHFYEHPDTSAYLRAREVVVAAIEAASEHSAALPLLDHLHLIRLALLDGQSVLADYMPAMSPSTEIANAS
jgi:uncharacterized membrane protein YccC